MNSINRQMSKNLIIKDFTWKAKVVLLFWEEGLCLQRNRAVLNI